MQIQKVRLKEWLGLILTPSTQYLIVGLEVGGYDLIAWTRKVSSKWLAITNETIPSACMASGWYDYLLQKVKRIR